MKREIEVDLTHIVEDLTALVEYTAEFYRDSHGAPYGHEEWVETEILSVRYFIDLNTPYELPYEYESDVQREICKQKDKDIDRRNSWEEIA